ncbi:MAG: MGH1-like glycoside hydrolase domain-containing protein [bacterium]
MTDIELRTIDIALSKLDRHSGSGRILLPRLGTGGGFADIFFWDTVFTAMWAVYHRDALPVFASLDNLYRLQERSGLINRQYLPNGDPKWSSDHPIAVAPPVLAWAELEMYSHTHDRDRLRRVFGPLVRHHGFVVRFLRGEDGLYFSDPLGCGMDNLPRWPRSGRFDDGGIAFSARYVRGDPTEFLANPALSWNRQARWIDISSQMALDAWCLAEIAAVLGESEEEASRRAEHERLAELINALMWDEGLGGYVDRLADDPRQELGSDRRIDRLHVGGFWPLIARVATAERAERLAGHLNDEATFGTPVPVPSLARNDPDFDPAGGYWRGASWAPTTYMVLRGLSAYGFDRLARRLAERAYEAVVAVYRDTGTIWENYSSLRPEAGSPPAQPDFCGWSGLYTVTLPREYLDRG